jgi:predicted nucleic acid-binding protein
MNMPGPLSVIDGLLAATARALGLTLATRNVAVKSAGVEVFDPVAG